MKKQLRKIYTLPVFMATGRVLFAMSRVSWLESPSLGLARFFARVVHWVQGRRSADTAETLAQEWNRLMPAPRAAFPILRTEGETAYVEIRAKCPLRGTGDAEACWRSMEFDRELMRKAGGRLVVMESQSVTGGPSCKLAIRPANASVDDLPVAHPRWRNQAVHSDG